MHLLMLKTWSGLSKVGNICSLSFPGGVHFKLSPLARLFCCRILFRLSRIITNMSGVSPYDVCWRRQCWRAVRLKWHGDTSHPLPLSISSRCSRLMELLIGENSGFPDARFPCRWDVWGGRPCPYLLLQKRRVILLLLCVSHFGGEPKYPTTMLFTWLHLHFSLAFL